MEPALIFSDPQKIFIGQQYFQNENQHTDERANTFPCLQRAKAECSSRCSVSDILPYAYTKQASAKTTEWSGSPRLLAHSTDSQILYINIFILNYCNLQVNVTQYPMMINRTSVNIVLKGIYNTNYGLIPSLIIKIFRNFVA